MVTLLWVITDLCRIFTSGWATAGCMILNHPDPTALPNFKFLQKNGFTQCDCMTSLLSLAQDFQGRAAANPYSCTSLWVSIYNFCRIQRLQIISVCPGAPQSYSAASLGPSPGNSSCYKLSIHPSVSNWTIILLSWTANNRYDVSK